MTRLPLIRCVVAATLCASFGAVVACPLTSEDGDVLGSTDLRLAWKLVERPAIEVSETFAIDVRACPADAELIRVDAVMPAHRHGMNYKPSIEAISPGRWRVRGLLWHMRGAWELSFELRHAGRVQTLRRGIELQ